MSSGSQVNNVATTGIWVDDMTTVTSDVRESATVEQAVGFLQLKVSECVSQRYFLDPPLNPLGMQAKYFPSGANDTDRLSILGSTGLTALFSPSAEQNRRIQHHLVQKEEQNKRLMESHKALADAAIADLGKPVTIDKGKPKKPADSQLQEMLDAIKDLRHVVDKQNSTITELRDIVEKRDGIITNLRKDLEKERAERIEDLDALRQVTLSITPLHLRVLLDLARKKVLEHLNYETWEDLRADRTVHQLADAISHELLQKHVPHSPSRQAVVFLCSYNNVRRAGNTAAHSAGREDIRAAVTTRQLESQDRRCLEQMFEFIYNGEQV